MIDIACATDMRYLPHCATMLRSLFAHTATGDLRIHVLHGGDIGEAAARELELFIRNQGAHPNLIAVSPEQIAGFPDGRFHVSCWYRILLPDLLPDVGRVLYLDSDMVILGDLLPLWRQDLGDALFGAVINPLYPFMPDRAAALGLSGPDQYLNSGVLLMDLARLRAERIGLRIKDYGTAHPDNPWPEQDALSVICRGRWLRLSPRWNSQSTLFDLPRSRLPFSAAEIRAARTDPAIVHFIGPLKPWHYLCRHPLRDVYSRYRRETPWPQFELEGRTWRNRLLRPFSLSVQLRLRGTAARLRSWLRARPAMSAP